MMAPGTSVKDVRTSVVASRFGVATMLRIDVGTSSGLHTTIESHSA
jgi:hypothetical protein